MTGELRACWLLPSALCLLPSVFCLLSLAFCLCLAACSDAAAPKARFLSIATGGTGGVYYPYGGGIAKILNESLPGVRATAEVTAASVDNLKLIRDGRADLAFTYADTLADAVHGRGAFQTSGPVPAASLAVLYSNYMHVVTLESSKIRTIQDLRGTVISTGSPGSGTEVLALRLLRAVGLDADRDVRRQGLGASESAEALKDGKVDAFFWGGGVPSPAVQELSHTPGIAIRLVPTGDLVPALVKEYGGVYFPIDVPAGAYGVRESVPAVGSSNVLVVNTSMDEELAHDITRVLFEKQSDLAMIHPEARKLSLQTAAAGSPAAFHPGAIRFYRGKGVWKDN
jgi:TRAP transporter TAXI family solute receptor